MRRQYNIYSRYADEVIFAFIDEVPQEIQESLLKELGELKVTIQFGP